MEQQLISKFGKQWSTDAICYHLEPTSGNIVGTVMHRSKAIGSTRGEGLEKYDVVWKFTGLGETSVLITHLLDGHTTAQSLLKARQEMKPSINNDEGKKK
jgi:hypothetical protein